MEFILNEYHHDVTSEELIQDIQRIAKQLQTNKLSRKEYSENGKYSSSTIERRFGSWTKACKEAGLQIREVDECTIENVIKDVIRVRDILKKESITREEYTKYGQWHASHLSHKFGSWNKVLSLAGLKVNLNRNFTAQDLLKEIYVIWVTLGRQPTATDIKNGISKYSLNTYTRMFGSWRKALEAFIDYINNESNRKQPQENIEITNNVNIEKTIETRKTRRDINLRLRFLVMKRDDFKCCICGRSPSNTPGLTLHIDHIIPWSQGGETILENLQTLCQDCNLGKSNI